MTSSLPGVPPLMGPHGNEIRFAQYQKESRTGSEGSVNGKLIGEAVPAIAEIARLPLPISRQLNMVTQRAIDFGVPLWTSIARGLSPGARDSG